MDRITGFYRSAPGGQRGKANERRRLQTRIGISRQRGTVAEGILYQRQVLPQGASFAATVRVDPALAERWQAFIEDAAQAGVLRVGTGRTRGLGRLDVVEVFAAPGEAVPAAAIGERVAAFTADLRALARDHKASAPGYYVPITLAADMLLPEAFGRWRLTIDSETLAATGLPGARLLHVIAGTHRIAGWNNLLGLPRPAAHAIAMGSVFLFAFDRRPDDAALARLERDGLGSRRSEGFGMVCVADRFHREVNEQ